MRIVMVDGGAEDGAQLLEIARRAGFELSVSQLSLTRIDVQITSVLGQAAPPPPSCAAVEPASARARALLFESLDRPELAAAVLGAVRAEPWFDGVPAIVSLTIDRSDWFEVVQGFEDFMLHPYSRVELLGRIHAAERRRAELGPELVEVGGIWMDTVAREAQVDGRSVHLTAREFALLAYLSVRRGRVLSREHLLEHVWGRAYHGGPRTVDVHIRRLRSKLGSALPIDTIRSGGYRLRPVGPGRHMHAPPRSAAAIRSGIDRRLLGSFGHDALAAE
jgi:DNA-binding winged helix-turn-helix (wHTH) protein